MKIYNTFLYAIALTGVTAVWSTATATTADDVACLQCITAPKIANDSVNTLKIKNGAVREADLAVGAVTSSRIKDLSIKGNDIAPRSVNESKLSLVLLNRITALESTPASVTINCSANANALKNATITADTTYNITGACNGPIYVEEDNVHLLGSSYASDSIVLPAGQVESAVFADGAHNLKITNLFLNLSATTTANYTGGIWSRASFVRLRDSRIHGGSVGIEAYRGSTVRLDGANIITGFSGSGLNASDQSNINTRGQTTMGSARTDDQYMKALYVYRGSSIDVRGGITVSVPTSTSARAAHAFANGTIRIRDSGTVTLTGDIRSEYTSSIRIDRGTINGEVSTRNSSTLQLNDGVVVNGRIDGRRGAVINLTGVTQTSTINGAIRLNQNSSLNADDSDLGNFNLYANSSASVESSTVKGGEIHLGSVATVSNTFVTEDIAAFPPAAAHITGSTNLNGNNVYGCNTASYIDVNTVDGIANLATAATDCRP